jgi:hypothetical protein
MLPNLIEPVKSFVTAMLQNGFVVLHNGFTEPVGNRTLELARGRSHLMISCYMRDWSIEYAESGRPEEWYYAALIREAMDGTSADDVMTIEQQAEYWRTRLGDVEKFFAEQGSEVHSLLDACADKVCRRQNPGWFK